MQVARAVWAILAQLVTLAVEETLDMTDPGVNRVTQGPLVTPAVQDIQAVRVIWDILAV
jgi:hypothetical protein